MVSAKQKKAVAAAARRARNRLVNRRHVGAVVGGAIYGFAEKVTVPLLSGILPNVPLGAKQALGAYALTFLPKMFKEVGYAGLAVEAAQAARRIPTNLGFLGGLGRNNNATGTATSGKLF